jgi:hypothetical protein
MNEALYIFCCLFTTSSVEYLGEIGSSLLMSGYSSTSAVLLDESKRNNTIAKNFDYQNITYVKFVNTSELKNT